MVDLVHQIVPFNLPVRYVVSYRCSVMRYRVVHVVCRNWFIYFFLHFLGHKMASFEELLYFSILLGSVGLGWVVAYLPPGDQRRWFSTGVGFFLITAFCGLGAIHAYITVIVNAIIITKVRWVFIFIFNASIKSNLQTNFFPDFAANGLTLIIYIIVIFTVENFARFSNDFSIFFFVASGIFFQNFLSEILWWIKSFCFLREVFSFFGSCILVLHNWLFSFASVGIRKLVFQRVLFFLPPLPSRDCHKWSMIFTFAYLAFFRSVTLLGLPETHEFCNAVQLILTLKVCRPHGPSLTN